jgi:hypothetical protein
VFANTFDSEGEMQADVPNLRRFLVWMGLNLPVGEGLGNFDASGAYHSSGATLTLDDGNFALDGNNAVGLLAVTAGTRPRIEATLAFERLVLDPYVANLYSSNGVSFDKSLLKHIDADLRISATTMMANKRGFGPGAFTIGAKTGALFAEVSELEICNGVASGRLGIDVPGEAKPLTLRADISDIAAESCLQQFGLSFPVRGTSSMKAELTSEGRTGDDLLHNLAGTLKVKAKAGAVPVNLGRLMAQNVPIEGSGWSASADTPFQSMSADCSVAGGHMWCQAFSMETSRGLVSGAGEIDLPRRSLDWTLSVTAANGVAKPSAAIAAEMPKLSIRGSLAQPTIKRGDRQAEGNIRAGSLMQTAPPRY